MEVRLYRALEKLIWQVAHPPRRKKEHFHDKTIVLVLIWAVLHDRAICWACDERNWPRDQAIPLPSPTTMSRRLRTVGVLQLLDRVLCLLREQFDHQHLIKAIDSKPLRVGYYSQDRDARKGRAGGGLAKGYKLHALTCDGIVTHWMLSGMNENDQVPAYRLLEHLKGVGYVAGDNGYDANKVHQKAEDCQHQLVAPPRNSNHNVRDLKRNCPARLRSQDLCDSPLFACGQSSVFGRSILKERVKIERLFSQLCFEGLNSPPPWVRTPHRVAQWTAVKLLIRLLKQAQKSGVM
jgi:hypothetical protein